MYKKVALLSIQYLFCTLGLKIQRVRLLGRIGNISVLGGKESSTKELIHDGTTWERKWSSLHRSGRQGERRGNEIERFYYGR